VPPVTSAIKPGNESEGFAVDVRVYPVDAQEQYMLDPIVTVPIAIILLRAKTRHGRATQQ
jgi:hypothetical protein